MIIFGHTPHEWKRRVELHKNKIMKYAVVFAVGVVVGTWI